MFHFEIPYSTQPEIPKGSLIVYLVHLYALLVCSSTALTLKGDSTGRPTSHVTLSNNVRIDKKDVSVNYDELTFQHELGQGKCGPYTILCVSAEPTRFDKTNNIHAF